MNGINEVLLLGTVGNDPETKILNENSRVSTFRLATNENYTDKSGVKKESTEWHNVEAWNYLSDTIANYVKKGTHIIIRGKIKTESYDDNQVAGRKVYRTKIVMDNLHFLPNGKKPEGQNGQVATQTGQIPQNGQGFYQQQPVQQPAPQPIYQQQPVQQPAPQPIYQQQPVQQPAPQPIYQQQPIPQQQPNPQQRPVQQQQQPVPQPVYQQQPMPQQQAAPVAQQPAQEAVQQTTQYMTNQQFLQTMNSPDDLPF